MFYGERSFWFDNYSTWDHWRCILTRKDVTPPQPKTSFIELDGMNGTLDLTKWQHDLYRFNGYPYDPNETKLIRRFCDLADKRDGITKYQQ